MLCTPCGMEASFFWDHLWKVAKLRGTTYSTRLSSVLVDILPSGTTCQLPACHSNLQIDPRNKTHIQICITYSTYQETNTPCHFLRVTHSITAASPGSSCHSSSPMSPSILLQSWDQKKGCCQGLHEKHLHWTSIAPSTPPKHWVRHQGMLLSRGVVICTSKSVMQEGINKTQGIEKRKCNKLQPNPWHSYLMWGMHTHQEEVHPLYGRYESCWRHKDQEK